MQPDRISEKRIEGVWWWDVDPILGWGLHGLSRGERVREKSANCTPARLDLNEDASLDDGFPSAEREHSCRVVSAGGPGRLTG